VKGRAWLGAILAGALLAGCATARDRLYQDLGGQPGVEALVEELLHRLADDERIAERFADTHIPRLRRMLIEQICNLSGGPCAYTGESMLQVHAGMNLSEADFNALVEDLIDAMRQRGVPLRAQNRLLALLAPMRADIVHQ
jgi:hemoglobin